VLPIAVSTVGERPGWRTRLASLSLTDTATLVVFALIASLMLIPTKDPDLFWHLATGRWIADHRRIPTADPFSWTANGRRWIAHEWLTETLLWALHRIGGYPLLSLAAAAIVLTAMFLTWRTMRRLDVRAGWAAALTLLGGFSALPTWGVRPQMLSFALLALVVSLTTQAWRTGVASDRRRLWVIPPVCLVWANLHGGYIFGIAVVGAYAVGVTIETLLATRRRTALPELAKAAWAVTAASALATLANPNGLSGFTYPFSYLGDNASTRYVSEWFAPKFSKPDFWPLALLLVIGALAVVRGRHRLPVHAWLQLVPLTVLALQSIRNSSPFVAVVLPWIALGTSRSPAVKRNRKDLPQGGAAVHFVVVLATVVVLGSRGASSIAASSQQSWHATNFPVAAVDWMKTHPAPNLLNRYDWGGYLILDAPSNPVSMDGRPDMYGDAAVDRYVSIWELHDGWRDRLRADGYRRVLGAPSDRIVQALRTSPDWTITYRDRVAVVLDQAATSWSD
jgi:hypothetical protein